MRRVADRRGGMRTRANVGMLTGRRCRRRGAQRNGHGVVRAGHRIGHRAAVGVDLRQASAVSVSSVQTESGASVPANLTLTVMVWPRPAG